MMRPGHDSTLQTLAWSWHTVTLIRASSRLAQTATAVPVVASGVQRSQCQDVVRGDPRGSGRRLVKRGTDSEAEAQGSSGEEGFRNVGTTSERGLAGQVLSFPTPVCPSAHGRCLGSGPWALQGLLTPLSASFPSARRKIPWVQIPSHPPGLTALHHSRYL